MLRTRREFLAQAGIAGVALLSGCRSSGARRGDAELMTVLGPIPAGELGPTLPHEHLFLDFVGADQVSRARYDPEIIFQAVLPQLQLFKDCGGEALVECTPAYIGRDPALLRRLAQASGVHLLTNTGYYGAAKNKFLPAHAFTESADQLAARWVQEWREGIEDTSVRPGFIKIGVDAGKLPDAHRKLVQAAARTHLASGLTIAAHTGNGVAALEELQLLREEGVAPQAFIWVHAQSERDESVHLRAAALGAWVEFDNVSPKSLARHVVLVQNLRRAGLLQRVLISHDAGWYEVGKPNGGPFRSFDTLFKQFIPALQEAGFTSAEIEQLLVKNPRDAFQIQLRPA